MKIAQDDFAARFKNDFLRRVLSSVQYDIPGVPMAVHLAFLAGCHNRTLMFKGLSRTLPRRSTIIVGLEFFYMIGQ